MTRVLGRSSPDFQASSESRGWIKNIAWQLRKRRASYAAAERITKSFVMAECEPLGAPAAAE